jgi:hypothetical protein
VIIFRRLQRRVAVLPDQGFGGNGRHAPLPENLDVHPHRPPRHPNIPTSMDPAAPSNGVRRDGQRRGGQRVSEVIRTLDLKGGLFLEARMTAPWAFTAQVAPEDCRPFMDVPAQVIAYHAVTHGRMLVAVEGQAPMEARAGDIILLPRNDARTVMSDPGNTPALGDDLLLPPGPDGLVRIDYGDGGEETRMLCGFPCERRRPASHPRDSAADAHGAARGRGLAGVDRVLGPHRGARARAGSAVSRPT